jgi:hypothetical protein
MADVSKLEVTITTGHDSQADANGPVYLGFGSREFRLKRAPGPDVHGDFESGAETTFRFGDGSNVANAAENDPRAFRIEADDVDKYDVYIRHEPPDNKKWLLGAVTVTATGPGINYIYKVGNPVVGGGNIAAPGIWLGRDFGLIVYLQKQ